jgi:transposase
VSDAQTPHDSALKDELERLRRELEELKSREKQLERERDELRRENSELREKLEAAERAAMRQVAPFRVPPERRSAAPRPPGRKPGHVGAFRPPPAAADETVEAPMMACPECGGEVSDCRAIEQFVEDIPQPRPHVLRIVTYSARCHTCGPVMSRHPRQMSTASGAAAVQIGPNALGIAIDLNKRLGIPMRKTCDVLKEHFGFRLTPGGLVHAEARLAQKLGPAYRRIRQWMRKSPNVCSDETGWWVNGTSHWLWVFTSPKGTLFRVDSRRRASIVTQVLGRKFAGVLSSDCLNVYDSLNCAQHKCYAHHLQAIRKAEDNASSTANTQVLKDLRILLLKAIAVGKMRNDIAPAEFQGIIVALEKWADKLIVKATADPVANKVGQRLLRQRDHLFTFLRYPGVDATNNAAERALRPAVIARKLSCGNRTDRGRETWEVLASVSATCGQHQKSFAKVVRTAAPASGGHDLNDLLEERRR